MFNCDGMHVLDVQRGHRKLVITVETDAAITGLCAVDLVGGTGPDRDPGGAWQRDGLIVGRRVDGRREHFYHLGQHRPPGNACRDAPLARYQKPGSCGGRLYGF
jgi:hypothetical protein